MLTGKLLWRRQLVEFSQSVSIVILTRIYYFNAVLHGTLTLSISKLTQHIQNSATRIVL